MTTDSINMRPPIMSYVGYAGRGLILLIVLAVAGLALVVNYWFGLGLLFLGLLAWILFGFKGFQGRNLLLLLYALAFVAIISSSIAYAFLAPDLLTSLLVGVGISFVVIVPFFLMITVAAVGILKWHKYQDVSFFQSFRYLLSITLGLRYLWIIVDDKKILGDEDDKKRLETFGGPGWLTVYPGHVVVLHNWGKISRVVEPGFTMLDRHEKIKAVLSLEPAGGVNVLENVLTKDRVPLTLTVLHAVKLEPASATKARGGTTNDDRVIGDDFDQCYESIARLAAQKAPDMWGAVKFSIANSVRDLIMTCNFEDLFGISQDDDSEGLEVRANQRKLAEIEKTIYEKAKDFGLKKGVMLLLVDVNGIEYPEEIKDKINKQATAHLDVRIKQDEAKARKLIAEYEARAKLIEAESEERAAKFQASTRVSLAQAEAQAEKITEEAKMRARADNFKQIIEALKAQGQSPETIDIIVQNLASSSALEDQLTRAIKLITHRQVTGRVQKQINSG